MFKRKAFAMNKGTPLTPRVVNTVIADARINIIENEKLKEAQAKLNGTRRNLDAREILKQQRLIREGKLEVKSSLKGSFTITTKTDGNLELTSNKKVVKQSKRMAITNHPKNLNKRKEMFRKARAKTVVKTQSKQQVSIKRREELRTIKLPGKERTFVPELDLVVVPRSDPRTQSPVNYLVKGKDGEWTIVQKNERGQHESKQDTGHLDDEQHDLVRRYSSGMSNHDEGGQRRNDALRSDQSQLQQAYLNAGPVKESLGPQIAQAPTKVAQEYIESYEVGTRLFVSNLHQTVSEKDIRELFGEIGLLRRVSLVARGVAEVIYVSKASAIQAVQRYHNRLLDGNPMKCHIEESSRWLLPLQDHTVHQEPYQSPQSGAQSLIPVHLFGRQLGDLATW